MTRSTHLLSGSALRVSLLAAAASFAHGAGAQVIAISIGKARYFDQSSANTQPTTAGVFAGYTYAATDQIDGANEFVVTGPGSEDLFPLSMPNNGFGQHGGFLGYYNTFDELQTAVPTNVYTFTCDGGSLGMLADAMALVVPFLEDDSEIPYVTGDGFDRIQNMDPSLDFTVEVNGFTPPNVATDAYTTIFIYQSCGGDVDYRGYNLAPDETSLVIPAGTLEPAREYVFTVSHTSEYNQPNTAFGGNANIGQYWLSRTSFTFLVGYDGCLADLTHDGLVDLEDFFAFFNAFDIGDAPADLNGCGGVDLNDFFLFFNAFDANDCGL